MRPQLSYSCAAGCVLDNAFCVPTASSLPLGTNPSRGEASDHIHHLCVCCMMCPVHYGTFCCCCGLLCACMAALANGTNSGDGSLAPLTALHRIPLAAAAHKRPAQSLVSCSSVCIYVPSVPVELATVFGYITSIRSLRFTAQWL